MRSPRCISQEGTQPRPGSGSNLLPPRSCAPGCHCRPRGGTPPVTAGYHGKRREICNIRYRARYQQRESRPRRPRERALTHPPRPAPTTLGGPALPGTGSDAHLSGVKSLPAPRDNVMPSTRLPCYTRDGWVMAVPLRLAAAAWSCPGSPLPISGPARVEDANSHPGLGEDRPSCHAQYGRRAPLPCPSRPCARPAPHPPSELP